MISIKEFRDKWLSGLDRLDYIEACEDLSELIINAWRVTKE